VADLYASYTALAAAKVEGVDYTRTAVSVPGARWASIAIHGGGIEAGSGEVATAVAGNFMSSYVFAGIMSTGNSDLHVTSTNFNEPIALSLVGQSRRTLSFHGYTGTGTAETAIGGLDTALVARITTALQGAGFQVISAASEIAGVDPLNICNQNLTDAGVQLELSLAQRQAFFPGGDTSRTMRESGQRTAAFYAYVNAIQSVFADMRVGVTFPTTALVDFSPKLMGNQLFWIGPNADGLPPSWQDPRFLYCRDVGAVPIVGMRLDGDTTRYEEVIDHLSNLPNWFPVIYLTEHAEPEIDYHGNHTAFIQNFRDWYINVVQKLPPTIRAKIKAGPVLSHSWTEDPALGGGNWARFDPGLGYSDFFGGNMLADPGVQPTQNWAPNPSLETDATGYGSLLSNATFARIAATGAPRGSYIGRATWTAAQAGGPDGGIGLPQFNLPYVGVDMTLYCQVRSSRAQVLRFQVWCYDGNGSYIGDGSPALTSSAGAGTWTELSQTFSFPAGTVSIKPSVRADVTGGSLWQVGDTLDIDAVSAVIYEMTPTVAASYPDPDEFLAGFGGYRLSASDIRPRVIPLLGAIGLPYDIYGLDRADWAVACSGVFDEWNPASTGWSFVGFTWLHGEGRSGATLVGLGPMRYYQLDIRQTGLNTRADYGDVLPEPLYAVNYLIIYYSDDPDRDQPDVPSTPSHPQVPPTTIELPPGGIPTTGPAAARLLAADYTILVTNANLTVIGDPIYEWDTLQCGIRWKEPGSGSITVPAHQYIRDQLVPGSRIVVIRRVLGTYHILLAGPVEKVMRERADTGENGGVGKLTINFVEDLSWLAARLAFPDPSKPIDQQTTDYWNFSGDPEAAMLQLVNTQAGAGALPQRRVPGLVVAPYSGVAGTGTVALGDTSTVAPRERLERLTDILRKICTIGANPVGSTPFHPDSLGFRTRQTMQGTSNVILFEPVRSRDLTGEVHFSFGRGNLEYYSFELEAPSLTHAMVGGQGEGAERALREISTTDPENLAWGRYEGYVAAPGTDTLSVATAAGQNEMADKLASARLATNASDTVDQRYGVHYNVGDLVSVELDADEYVKAPIQTVNVQAWPTAGEVVGVTIGDQSARYDSDWIKRMLDLERRLGRQERR
jgi:phage replication-related protein YjqB (UPF0714/DUF867 family)